MFGHVECRSCGYWTLMLLVRNVCECLYPARVQQDLIAVIGPVQQRRVCTDLWVSSPCPPKCSPNAPQILPNRYIAYLYYVILPHHWFGDLFDLLLTTRVPWPLLPKQTKNISITFLSQTHFCPSISSTLQSNMNLAIF